MLATLASLGFVELHTADTAAPRQAESGATINFRPSVAPVTQGWPRVRFRLCRGFESCGLALGPVVARSPFRAPRGRPRHRPERWRGRLKRRRATNRVSNVPLSRE